MAVLTEEMRRVVTEQRLGFVASVCPDGTPNLSPKGSLSVWDDDHLVFVDLASPGTVANVRLNPAVEVNVVDPFMRKGFRFKGTAQVVEAGDLFERLISFFSTKAVRVRERASGFVIIRVQSATALTSPAYDLGADEREIIGQWFEHHRSLVTERLGQNPLRPPEGTEVVDA